jgi:hypothetical protein
MWNYKWLRNACNYYNYFLCNHQLNSNTNIMEGRVIHVISNSIVQPEEFAVLFEEFGEILSFLYDSATKRSALIQFAEAKAAIEANEYYEQDTLIKVSLTNLHDIPEIQTIPRPIELEQDVIDLTQTSETQFIEKAQGWVTLHDESRLEEFLTLYAPSKTSSHVCDWISVRHNDNYVATYDLNKLEAEWQILQKNYNKKVTESHLEMLARKHNLVVGKWLCFASSKDIDAVWNIIARAVVNGQLGASAKVGSKEGNKYHVICVYTDDYLDLKERNRIGQELKRILKSTCIRKLQYKPDIYTHLGIYAGHPYIKPVVSTMQWK